MEGGRGGRVSLRAFPVLASISPVHHYQQRLPEAAELHVEEEEDRGEREERENADGARGLAGGLELADRMLLPMDGTDELTVEEVEERTQNVLELHLRRARAVRARAKRSRKKEA